MNCSRGGGGGILTFGIMSHNISLYVTPGEIFAFNVETSPTVSKMAKSRDVPIRVHNVIYHLFHELRDSMSSRLPKVEEENVIG